MVKAHTPINWENEPSYNTPLNAENLNKMDSEIGILDDRIIEQDTSKLDKSTAYTMVKDISFNDNNGVFTVTRLNGSTFTIDTKLEKISINFDYNKETQQIEIIFVDGTKEYIDISSLISPIDFVDSDTIGWEVTSDWKVKAKVLNGSITEDMLQPNYLAEIKVETERSAQSMANAKISENNAKQSELNAKASEEQALEYSNNAKPLAQSVTGDDPTITNSTVGNVIYLKNSGYTEQKTLSGKNILNPTLNVTTAYGVTCTDNGDGTYILNGTATQDATFFLYNSTEPLTDIKGKLRLVGCPSGGSSNTFGIGIANTSWVGGNDVGNGMTIDTNTHTPNRVYIFVKSGATLNGKVFKPMVTTDTTATYEDFEPYCGGIASPNPDYPQEIKGLGDKGYFDGELVQGYIGSSGTIITDSHAITSKNIIPCSEEDTIVINYEETVVNLAIATYNNGTYVGTIDGANVSSNSYTIPSGVDGFKFFIYDGNGITPSTAKHISVTINGQYAVRVKTRGKNLLDARLNTTIGSNDSYEIEVKPNTSYTLSLTQLCTILDDTYKGAQHNLQKLDADKNVLQSIAICEMSFGGVGEILTRKRTITTSVDTVYLRLDLGTYFNSTTRVQTIEAQLEESTVATDYEPYTETQALIPISTPFYEGDYIEVFADGSGREYRKMGSVVYDGSEEWYSASNDLNSENAKTIYYTTNNSVKKNNPILFCDRYKKSNNHYSEINNFEMQGYNHSDTTYPKQNWLYFKNNNCSTVDEWKKELANNPIHVVYELATPTTEPLTAEQVQAFKQLQTFNEVTHINADGEVTVRYYCNNDSGDTVGMLHEMVEDTQNQIDTKLNGIFKIVEVGTVLGGMQPGDIHKDLYIDINRFIEDGYLPISISGYNVDKSDVNLYRLELNTTEGKIYFSLYNTSSEFALASVSLDIKVLLVKEEFFAN